jgi:SecD/SecF fusion protein
LAVTSLLIFGGATLQDFAFAMLVGIASGTYSSIFIASPVLAAWKEREPGFIRRRLRITEAVGSVPAFADDVPAAEFSADDESEAAIAAELAEESQAEPQRGAVATAERTGEGNGADPVGDGGGEDEDASSERRQRNAERRARRQQRRKHGRSR